jgi:predicted nucleic acid-binding protein
MLDLDHAIYDCLYLALSMQRRIPLLTADKRLVAAAARHPSLNGLATLFPSGMR